jgi:3-oxoacyl-[acyl-carrier-protein] synthase II
MGPVTAIGTGREAFAGALLRGAVGIAPLERVDASDYGVLLGAEIRGFDVEPYLLSAKAYLDRASELALAGVRLALDDAGLDPEGVGHSGAGLILGSALGSMETMGVFYADFLEKGPRLVKPFLFPHTYCNTAISLVAMDYGLDGYHLQISAGAVSSAAAVLQAFDRIRAGRESWMLVGGVDALSRAALAGMALAGRLSTAENGGEKAAPFGADRNGCVLGEAAGILVLEDREHALARKARIYAELAGGALGGDVEGDAFPGSGLLRGLESMRAGAETAAPGVVFAAANGSPEGDLAEARALAKALAGAATPVTAIKGAAGETLGAGAALQVMAAALAMGAGTIPATGGVDAVDPGVELDVVVGGPRMAEARSAWVTSTDAGGGAACVALIKHENGDR